MYKKILRILGTFESNLIADCCKLIFGSGWSSMQNVQCGMISTKDLFHYISYLQYPILLVGLYYSFKPILWGFETMWEDYNNTLVYMGLAISFSTLQDTQKTQNELSRKVWENPKAGKRFIMVMALFTLVFMVLGLVGMYADLDSKIKELSFGLLMFSIGLMGLLKAAIEMFEHHRKDKKTPTNVS